MTRVNVHLRTDMSAVLQPHLHWIGESDSMIAIAVSPELEAPVRDTTVTDVARNFADYVNRVAYRGERFLLHRGGKPVAELGPPAAGVPVRDIPALFASLPRFSPDEAARFAADLESARADADAETLRDPWES